MPSNRLDRLPTELLNIIIGFTEDNALRSLSCVSRGLRVICIPYLFKTLHVTFSVAGFRRLEQVSDSELAQYVKEVHYQVPELIDPYISHLDYFRSCIYTPEEFIKDQKEQWWSFRGKSLSYESIYKYFVQLSAEQQKILSGCDDARTLSICLPRFLNLQSFQLVFEDSIDQPFHWLATRLFFDWNDSTLMHLETVIDVLISLRQHGISIHSFGVSGYNSTARTLAEGFLRKLADALHPVTDIALSDSTDLLQSLALIPLPSILRLKLGSCWLSIADLGVFSSRHNSRLQQIHFENVWVPANNLQGWGAPLRSECIATIMDKIHVPHESSTLQRITVSTKEDSQNEFQDWVLSRVAFC
ncbi:uncharacterized protein BDW70DRAFT_154469 [Aspergillus foveolatus]|uniref:uncharacterized protein n=1 Tax=Aspergillus foveolatus TaxID=210207 RepID=UPI003CCCED1C